MSEKENELAIVAKQSNLSSTKVQELLSQFGEPYKEAAQIATDAQGIIVTDENDTASMGKARAARLQLKNIRVAIEKTRKELKEESLREGKAIDGMANIIKALIVPVEEHLEKQEKFAEIKAAERKHARHIKRVEELSQYVNDISVYALEDMSDEAYAELLANAKEAKAAKLAAEKKAEEDRVAAEKAAAEKAEAERVENERRAKEAEKKQARMQQLVGLGMSLNGDEFTKFTVTVHWGEASVLDDKRWDTMIKKITGEIATEQKKADDAAAEQAKKDEEARKKRDAEIEAERKAHEEKVAAERKAAEEERQKREKLEREKKEREEREAKEKADAETAKRAALLAPDKEKLEALADVLDGLEMPHVSNREAIAVLNETVDFLTRISKNLRKKAKEL